MSFMLVGSLFFLLSACQQSSTPETAAPAVTPEPAANEVAATTDKGCTLVMGWDPWEPYHYEGPDGTTSGMDVEIVSSMAEGAGCELEFRRGEWAELIKLLQDGEVDLLAGATMIPERESFAWFSEPYRSETFSLHVSADSELDGDNLVAFIEKGFRLGLTDGYLYGPAITAIQDNPLLSRNIVYAPIAEYHFTNLVDGSIDGFLEDPYVAEAIARRHGWDERVREMPIRFGSHDVRLMFSRNSVEPDVVEKMNQKLAAMQQEGKDQSIMQRYQHQGP